MNWYILGAYAVTFGLLAVEVIFLLRRARKSETKA
jgi:hypothetical protein